MAAFAFAAVSLAALGLVGGYAVFLRRPHSAPGAQRPPLGSGPLPPLDVIVPTHDEAELVTGKIDDLRRIAYPGPLRFWIVDGASSDATCARARAAIGDDSRFRLISLGVANKTAQLNAALGLARSPWILVSDADARLAPDLPAALVDAGQADPGVDVVGAPSVPAQAHPLDRLHWQLCNRLRATEARRGSASHVVGPCYAFRRRLLERFPLDVANDDCHISFAAAVAGARVAWVDGRVVELRAPLGLWELFGHKRRKAAGYLHEVARFLPRAQRMRGPARAVFLWRAALLLAAPVLGAGALATGAAFAVQQPLAAGAAAGTGALIAILLGRGAGLRPGTLARLTALTGLLASALGAALLVLPFRPPDACYAKVSLTPEAPSPSATNR